MGHILSQPVVDKSSESGQDGTRFYYGMSSMQGWRISMEDAHATVLNLRPDLSIPADSVPDADRVSFFGVYDGHGGAKVAMHAGEHLHNVVARQKGFARGDYAQALKDGFLSMDRVILDDPSFIGDPSGCTATAALIARNRIYVANAGDSRTILAVRGIAKPLSFDHKPSNEGEKARIKAAGGFVDVGRVNGNLALSRAIGDFNFKKAPNFPPEEQVVTAYPDIIEHDITSQDEFLVLACDGIWDCMHNQAVVEFVRRGIAQRQDLVDICENLMDNCLSPTSEMSGIGCDNMTVMIVALLNGKSKDEWYDMIADRVANGEGPVAPLSAAERKGNPFTNSTGDYNNNNKPDDSGLSFPGFGAISLQQLGQSAMLGPDGSYYIQASDARGLLSSMGLVGFNPHESSPPPEDGDKEDDRLEELDDEK